MINLLTYMYFEFFKYHSYTQSFLGLLLPLSIQKINNKMNTGLKILNGILCLFLPPVSVVIVTGCDGQG